MTNTTVAEFNSSYSIQEVIERICNIQINPKKKFDCPICGKNDASINPTKNVFNCWSGGCTDGGVKPYGFADYYYRLVKGITDFKVLYKELDALFGTKLYKHLGPIKKGQEALYTKEYVVDKYCSDVDLDFFNDVLIDKRVLLKAGTGFGKSHMLAETSKKLVNDRVLDVEKVIFATPRGSIVEEIAERGFEKFYKNDVELPFSKTIATTTHKAPLLVQQLSEGEIELADGTIELDSPKDYLLIVDECHLLLTSRNIVVKENQDHKRLRQLIERAKYVIFTSANTDHFYNACKDEYNIKAYINIKRKRPIHNLEKLIIKRTTMDREIRLDIIIKDIIAEHRNGNKVFMVHNNIKDLRKIEEVLSSERILTKVLYSANKNSEEVVEDYIALIKKSVLNCDVTLCTSVVDTGVNIHESRVTTMLVQDQTTFDDVTTIQTFARVRVKDVGFHGNKGILYLTRVKNRLEKHDKFHGINLYLKAYTERAQTAERAFNMHMLNNYDVESYLCYKDVWELLRYNELYSSERHLLYIDYNGDYKENPRLAVDNIATYDKARRQYLSANYFNDEFIKNICKEVSTKELIILEDLREREEPKEEFNGETYQEVLNKLLVDPEFNEIIKNRYICPIKLEEEPFIIGYLKSEYRANFGKLDRRISAMCEMIKRTKVGVSQVEYVYEMITAHATLKGKALATEINRIEYLIYNKMYKDPGSYEGLGDGVYISVRRCFDKAVRTRHQLTDKALTIFTEQYLLEIEFKKYYLDLNDNIIKTKTKDKPVDLEKAKAQALELIQLIYNISDKKYLSLL